MSVAEGIEIWRLKSRYSDFRCLRCPVGAGWELRIYQEADIVVHEMFPTETPLLDRAQQLYDSMKSLGWEAV